MPKKGKQQKKARKAKIRGGAGGAASYSPNAAAAVIARKYGVIQKL